MNQPISHNIPRLRFPDFSDAWEEVRLGDDIADVIGGGTPDSQNKTFWDGGIQWFTPTEIKTKYLSKSERTLTKEGLEASSAVELPAGSLLFCSRATIGEIGIALEPCSTNQGFQSLIVKSGHHNEFWYYWIVGNKVKFLTQANGSTFKEISGRDVKKIDAISPKLPEQRKIAGFLGAVDRRIAALEARHAALATYKKGLMQQLFSQALRFTKPNNTPYPDWEEKRLGDVVTWISTNSFSRSQLKTDFGKVQNIHYGDIHKTLPTLLDQSKIDIPFISEELDLSSVEEGAFCANGDVIIADASEDAEDIGKAIEIINCKPKSLLAGLHTLHARPSKDTFARGFFGYYFSNPLIREKLKRLAQGISVLGISKHALSQIFISIPQPDEQKQIADFLSAIDRHKAALTQQITHSKAFKKALLQQMFV